MSISLCLNTEQGWRRMKSILSTSDWVAYGSNESASTTSPSYVPLALARTQKGIGIGALRQVYPPNTLQLLGIAQEESHLEGIAYPCFARPAPSTPKHGYIDSCVVADFDEAKTLLAKVLADDPKGELILCGFHQAAFNMIWTPRSLVIGRGHDGSTAGKP